MKKLLFSFIMIVLLSIPTCVLAASNLTIECDENNVAGQSLICTLNATIEEESEINKIEGDINFNDVTTTFELSSGLRGSINNNKLTINSDAKIESGSLGKLNIKYPIETTGTKEISLSNIKLYSSENFVNTISNVNDSVKIKSDVKTLQSLSVEDCDGCKLNPEFKSTLSIYSLTTTSDTIRITAIANGNATVTGSGLKKISKEEETLEIVVTSEAGNTKKYKINVKKVMPLSNDNSLKSLTLDNGELSPKFSSEVTSYTATVDKPEITINAITTDSKAKVTGIGKKILEYGKNDFNIVVTAEDGTVKNYLLVINRPDTRNANAYLKELTINGQQIGFEKDIVEYTYSVNNDVNKLDIIAKAEFETAHVTVTGNEDLKIGKNEIIITVEAEDGSTKEYKIIVNKVIMEKKEVLLQNLTIEGYNISFNPNTFDYDVIIKNEVKLNIIAIPENENYNVEILGNDNLKNGSIIKIIVTNDENESNIYKIKVSVSNNVEVHDNNNNNDINYIPYIMIGLLVILVILNIVEILKKYRKK